MELIKSCLVLLGALTLAGCQAMPYKPYARNVKLKPSKGGVIALKTEHKPEDRAMANNMMKQACGKKDFEILEEGEVAVGTITNTQKEEYEGAGQMDMGSILGINVISNDPNRTSGRTETIQKKEWQIHYECTRVAKAKSQKRVE